MARKRLGQQPGGMEVQASGHAPRAESAKTSQPGSALSVPVGDISVQCMRMCTDLTFGKDSWNVVVA